MKKIFALFIVLCCMFTLTGCVIIETDFPNIAEEDFPIKQDWESFTFKSLKDDKDLTVYKDSNGNGVLSVSIPKYKQDFLAIVVYKKDCQACKMQAPYFDKLSAELYGMNYIVIFSDIYEDTYNKDVEWIRDLSHIDAYTNVATSCSGGACQKVFTPFIINEPAVGAVYFVNKKNITKTRKGLTWNTTDDQEKLYEKMKMQVVEFLDLKNITFEPTVEPWDN